MTTADELRAQAAALLTKAAELETPLSQDDVHTMFKNRQYEAIEQARRDGRISYQSAIKTEGN
jgi:hypothetical protein